MTYKARIGSISTDTLRNEDLYDAFIYEYQRLDLDAANNFENDYALDTDEEGFYESENCADAIMELSDRLEEYAPPYCYFGAHDGDGADFGFWPAYERIEELFREASPICGDSNRRVHADDGIIIECSDHGNVTIWSLEAGEELLSIV